MLISPRSYTTVAVAKRLGVSLQTVQRWVDAGHLKAWKTLGGHRRIDATSAEQLFESQTLAIGVHGPISAAGSGAPEPLRVLVVEDDPAGVAVLTELIRAAIPGARIEVAANGFEALVNVGQFSPQLFVADLHLPHMDGFEMLRSLTAGPVRPATIVAVSQLPAAELTQRARVLPDVHFLAKPLDPEQFIRTVAQAR
jgi:excisionase family DNA binding protein